MFSFQNSIIPLYPTWLLSVDIHVILHLSKAILSSCLLLESYNNLHRYSPTHVAHSLLQNNLERSEFEARTRLGSQVETLQREVNLLKRKLESEEKHHKSIIETWEVRIRDRHSSF